MDVEKMVAMTDEDQFNEAYNERVANVADFERGDPYDDTTTGKRIPYIGWFWRDTDFARKRIYIGHTGDYIGVMENNKWDYPERQMTEAEATTFMHLFNTAFAEQASGAQENAEKIYAELRAWFQTLPF